MSSKYILNQLKKCVFADLSNFNATTNTYNIPKYTKPYYELGKCYLIQLPNYIINNSTTILAINWNNGSFPTVPCYKAYVSKVTGTFIYIDGLAYDLNNQQDLDVMWSGWLDTNELKQLAII